MKRAEAPVYVWHWIVIVAVISVTLLVRSHLQKSDGFESVPVEHAHNASDTRFVAIQYPKISRSAKSDSMSRSTFLEHMTELKSAGYCTVGLQQVCDLYEANKLLPDKTVVVLLDGHRDTCLNAVPVVEELGLQATVMLNIGAMRQTNRSFISWHDLRKMQKDPRWNFGIRTRVAGHLPEQLEYLKDRFPEIRVCGVSAPTDLRDSVTFSRDKRVFFPPRDGDGYNSSVTDPSCLSLLRVASQQSGRELVKTLASVFSQTPRIEDGFTEDARRLNWVSTCGNTRVIDGMFELSARPSRSSADAWSVGTYDWSDVDLAAEFKVVRGKQFWAYARFRNKDNFIRLGCDGKRLFLQQKIEGKKAKNLKVGEFECDFSQFHTLRLIARGSYAMAYLDGHKLSARPFRVDDSLASGKVGFAIWDSRCGVASCRIARTSVRKIPCVALLNMDWNKGAPSWLSENSDYLSYLCPNGLAVDAHRTEHNVDEDKALLISSAYGGHMLTPTVVLDKRDIESDNADALISKLVNLVKSHKLDGIHLDCRKCQGAKSSAKLTGILEAFKADSPESTLILSLSLECYQICKELLEIPDVLVVRLESQQCDLLNDIARPFRLKTLLRVATDEPWAPAERLMLPKDGQVTGNSTSDAIGVVQKYELRGIALCKG